MVEEPAEPRGHRGEALILASREDLELYGVSDLEERIILLQAEIERTKTQIERKRSSKSAADSFFKF
ncbi:MAG: DUF1192 domain-containing protein [Caulobacter sp.]|nr:DUF1192 domain-containing protein [Caulobacter sp.]